MLDMTSRQLERVIYYEDYIVIDPGNTPLQQLPAPHRSRNSAKPKTSTVTTASSRGMGAEAIRDTLVSHRPAESSTMRSSSRWRATRSKQLRKKLAKRLKLVPGLHATSKTRPEWMILERAAGHPAGPRVRSCPSKAAVSPPPILNDLYRRVINRNNRLKNPVAAQDAGSHHPQRKAHAAGSGGRLVRQRPSRPCRHRRRATVRSSPSATCSRARAAVSARTCSASASITPAVRSSSSVLSSSSTSAVCRRRWRSCLFEPFIIRRLKEQGHVHTVRSRQEAHRASDA